MAAINKVFILGNLGADPETRYATDGGAICNFRVATTRYWKDKQGDRKEETEWHRCVAFGRQGEVADEYLKKGNAVHVEGHLRTRKWTDKDDVDHYSTEIIVDVLTLIGGPSGGSRDDDDRDRGRGRGRDDDRGRGRGRDDDRGGRDRGRDDDRGGKDPRDTGRGSRHGRPEDIDDDIPF